MKAPLSLLRLALRNPTSAKPSLWIRPLSSSAFRQPSDRVFSIVDDISNLTLLEVSDLTSLLRERLNVDQMPMLAVISPGMSLSGGGVGPASAAAEEKAEEAEEKTAFDVKLEGFDAAAKIKVIKEVRAFTELGLKEAKELVEKAPVVVKGGVTKEEAEKIVEKLKVIGAKVVME